MSYTSYEEKLRSPKENGHEISAGEDAFFVLPMGGRNTKAMIVNKEVEDGDPAAEMGTSVFLGLFAGAMGLPHAFHMAAEIGKTALEIAQGSTGAQRINPDVNLDPRAALDPSKAFNFKKVEQPASMLSAKPSTTLTQDEERKPKNAAPSMWGDDLATRLAKKRMAERKAKSGPGLR